MNDKRTIHLSQQEYELMLWALGFATGSVARAANQAADSEQHHRLVLDLLELVNTIQGREV